MGQQRQRRHWPVHRQLRQTRPQRRQMLGRVLSHTPHLETLTGNKNRRIPTWSNLKCAGQTGVTHRPASIANAPPPAQSQSSIPSSSAKSGPRLSSSARASPPKASASALPSPTRLETRSATRVPRASLARGPSTISATRWSRRRRCWSPAAM